MMIRLELLKESPFDKTYTCINTNKAKIQPLYNSANNFLKTDSASNKLLVDLYNYWLESMDALQKDKDEAESYYQQRLDKRELELRKQGDKLLFEVSNNLQ